MRNSHENNGQRRPKIGGWRGQFAVVDNWKSGILPEHLGHPGLLELSSR
jgi:hypothetical protein